MDEAETRRRLIDEQLRLAGWDPDDPAEVGQEGVADSAQTCALERGTSSRTHLRK